MEHRVRQESLLPSDVVVLLQARLLEDEGWTFDQLASALGVSSSRVHDSIRRCERAALVRSRDRRVAVRNLVEFLVHGVRFAFPARVGASALGVPTAAFAAPMTDLLSATGDPYVWAAVGAGTVKGQVVSPLHPNVPDVSRQDDRMHQLLALVDSLRLGGSRERAVASDALRERLEAP